MIRIVKKVLHSSLAMVLVVGAVMMSSPATAYADHDPGAVQFAGGDGSSDSPYLIETPEQLNEVRNHLNDHFKLIADIDLTAYLAEDGEGYNGGAGWIPIGGSSNKFTGTFDGNHHMISGLRISAIISNIGLFGSTSVGAELKNVDLIDVDITCYQYCGGLVGSNEGNISNSSVTGSVYGDAILGGLVVLQTKGSISNSFANVTVNGDNFIHGGLVGFLYGGSISNSYATGSVNGVQFIGGLVGYQNGGSISHSYATGRVSGNQINALGGLVGLKNGGSVDTDTSFYDMNTTGQSDTGRGTGLPTSDMQTKSTYEDAGWDFTDHWTIDISRYDQLHNNGYPYLKAIQAYITYDGNGNTEGDAPFDSTSYHPSRSATVAGNTGELAITGYTFAGWNTAADGSGTSYDAGDNFTITEDNTLFAQWEANTYTVTFNAESGNVNPLEQTKRFASTYGHGADGVTEEGLPIPSRTGYTFAGWYDGPGGTGNEVANETAVQTTSDHTLYAKWTINQYTISYDGNGSVDGTLPGPEAVDYNESVTVAGNTGNLLKTGYTFAGWNTAADGSGTSYDAGDTLTVGATDVTLYAQWFSSNAMLADLSISHGTLDFVPADLNYSADVSHAVTAIDIYITKGDPTQVLTVSGAVYQTVTDSVYHYVAPNLEVGENGIQIQVMAQDGTEHDYSLSIQRISNNADLSGLSLSSGTMNPIFSSGITAYTASVPNSVSSLKVTPTAADADAAITVNDIAIDSGTTSGTINLNVGNNIIRVVVTAQDDMTTQIYTVTVVRTAAPSSEDEEEPTPSEPTEPTEPTEPSELIEPTSPNKTDLSVRIDGETHEAIATATTSAQDGQTIVTVTVDTEKLTEQLDQVGNEPVVTIPLSTQADKVTAALTGDTIKTMENYHAIVEIQTLNGSYMLPASEVLIDQLSEQLGAGARLERITLYVDIAKSENAKAELLAKAADKGSFTVVVPPVDFKVMAEFDNKTLQVTKFNTFVEREIAIPEGVDTNKITTAVVLNADGTTRSVPTKIVTRGGVTYAVINSLTNSTYSLVWNPVEFKDGEHHWSKDVVNDIGSRMIISGFGDGLFHPDHDITRAEFAAIIVRGLGFELAIGPAPFSDVIESSWYNNVIHTAHANNLIHGFDDGTFRPNDKITREQAMVILSKAMAVTKLSQQLSNPLTEAALDPYQDVTEISAWAIQAIADTVQAGIVSGQSATELAPRDNISRAEVAVMIHRLLRKSDLI